MVATGLHPATGDRTDGLLWGIMPLQALTVAQVTLSAVATSLEIPVRSGTISVEVILPCFSGTLGVQGVPVGFTDIRVQFDLGRRPSRESGVARQTDGAIPWSFKPLVSSPRYLSRWRPGAEAQRRTTTTTSWAGSHGPAGPCGGGPGRGGRADSIRRLHQVAPAAIAGTVTKRVDSIGPAPSDDQRIRRQATIARNHDGPVERTQVP